MVGEVRLQVPVPRERKSAVKVLAAARGTTVGELVRLAIEAQYGDELRTIERGRVSSQRVTAPVNKRKRQ